MKVCRICNIKKELSGFYKNSEMTDGHRHDCKKCCNNRSRTHRLNNLEHYRKYDIERSKNPARSSALKKLVQQRIIKYPEKYKAKMALNNAVRDGRVIKLTKCEDCQSERKLHGHHEDYSKKLDVVWLCVPCHSKRHHKEITI